MQSVINRAGWVLAGLISLLVVAAVAGIVHGGPLDPPGPPASTAGVLRPGTAIRALPFTISQPGSYYLTGNLAMTTTGAGITIASSNVTLDLGGFTLNGTGAGTDGITTSSVGELQSVRIHDGSADNWTGSGFNLAGASVAAEHLQASHDGIGVNFHNGALDGCTVNFDGVGVSADGSTISHCAADSDGTGFKLNGATLTDCSSSAASQVGINADGGNVSGCTINGGNTGMGLKEDCVVRNNLIQGTQFEGIRAEDQGSVIESNNLYFDGTQHGANGMLLIVGGNRVSHNNVEWSGSAGIDAEGGDFTVEDNTTSGNADVGIRVSSGMSNTVVRNVSTDNKNGNYDIAGSNAGPIVAAGSMTNPASNTE